MQQLATLLSTPPSQPCTPLLEQKTRNLHERLDQHANTRLTHGNRTAINCVVQIRSGKREPSFTHLHQRFCIVPPVPPSMNNNDHNSFCGRNPKGEERKRGMPHVSFSMDSQRVKYGQTVNFGQILVKVHQTRGV